MPAEMNPDLVTEDINGVQNKSQKAPVPIMDKHQRHDAVVAFERKYHLGIWTFIIEQMENKMKMTRSKARDLSKMEVLDMSEDSGIFSSLFAVKYKAKKLVSVIRPDLANRTLPLTDSKIQFVHHDFANDSLDEIAALGKFDIIILKEMLYLCNDNLVAFLSSLKHNMKPTTIVYILTRPKEPPLPLPESAMKVWRQMAPSRDEIVHAMQAVNFKMECFSVSCPIKIDREVWSEILQTHVLPAVHKSADCTDIEIRSFCDQQSKQMDFEEKFFCFTAELQPSNKK